jgi:hypothetical protein
MNRSKKITGKGRKKGRDVLPITTGEPLYVTRPWKGNFIPFPLLVEAFSHCYA